jgi:cation diffusion facilitator CzcD-associated flavoprotein CzcO
VPLAGARLGVIGTGSSAVQITGALVDVVGELHLFQRTPQWILAVDNPPISDDDRARYRADPTALVRLRDELNANFVQGFANAVVDAESPALTMLQELSRANLEEHVADPDLREKLRPHYRAGCKRLIISPNFYEAIQRPNARLVTERIDHVEAGGVRTVDGRLHELDVLVLATGFDAISGSMLRLNPKGRDGLTLKERWNDRFHNYLGLSIAGFPNLFMIHGPGSPGVFYNMPLGAERQVNWIGDFVRHLREQGIGAVEPAADSEAAWGAEVSAIADATLFPRTDSWWTGANIPGKPRYFSAYLGGTLYYQRLADVSAKGYEGFIFEPALQAEDAEAP